MYLSRAKRSLPFLVSPPSGCRWAGLGLVVAASLLGGCASTASPGSSHEVLVKAHTLPSDQLLAGPVLLGHRAVWAEAGRRLLVRSLDASGRTRTLFSTSATPGASAGTVWPFSVRSIAAGDGQVAFVERVITCASAPPHLLRCTRGTEGPAASSVTLFAGPPGAIRPVESIVHPHCSERQLPQAVAVAHGGLVVNEMALPCRGRPVLRRGLRSFSGSLVRVLVRGMSVETYPFPGMKVVLPAFDGRVVATAHDNTVQLAVPR
jgi:hypothetical protein